MKQKARKRFTAVITAWLMVFSTFAGVVPAAAQDPSGGYTPREMQTPAGEYMPTADTLVYTFRDGDVEEVPADATAVYEVPVRLWNNYEDRASMGNGAMSQTGQIVVTPDKTYFEVRLIGLKFLGMYGHLLQMSYNPQDPTAQPAKTSDLTTVADVVHYRTDFSLNTREATAEEIDALPANYPNRDEAKFGEIREFPHLLRMTYDNFDMDAALNSTESYNTFIRIAVVVDAMKALSGGDPYDPSDPNDGAQFARLQFDVANAKKTWAKYVVKFNPDNGEATTSVTVKEGETVAEPTAPTKEYHEFTGWYANDVLYDFTQPVTGPLELKAGWKVIPASTDDLQAAVDKAKKVINKSAELVAALDEAEQVLANPNAIQPAVDAALKKVTDATPDEVTITLKDSDGPEIKQVQAFVGDPFEAPEEPAAKPNNTFAHWAKRANSNKAEEFPFTVAKDRTLYAVYWYSMDAPMREQFRKTMDDIQFIYDNLRDKSKLKPAWVGANDNFLAEWSAKHNKPEMSQKEVEQWLKETQGPLLGFFTNAWRLDQGEYVEANVGDFVHEAMMVEPHFREGEAKPAYKMKKYEVPVRLHQWKDDKYLSMGAGGLASTSYFYEEDGKGSLDLRTESISVLGFMGHLWGIKYKEGDPSMPADGETDAWEESLVFAQAGEYFRDISLIARKANPEHYPVNYPVKGASFEHMVREFPHTFRLFDDNFDMATASEKAWGYTIAMQMVVDAMDAMQSVKPKPGEVNPIEDLNLYDRIKFNTWTPEAELKCDFKHATLIYDKTDLRAAIADAETVENPGAVLTAAIEHAKQVFDDCDTDQVTVDKAEDALKHGKTIDALEKAIADKENKKDEIPAEGWFTADNEWYYADGQGGVKTNAWIETDGQWYHVAGSGQMDRNTMVISDGAMRWVGNSGVMAQNQWVYDDGAWYYAMNTGVLAQNQWVLVDGLWYYAKSTGVIAQSQWVYVDGDWYYAGKSGAIAQNQWVYVNGVWYYATNSGRIALNQWVYVNGVWYYAVKSGAIAQNQWVYVNGEWYYATESGAIAQKQWICVKGTWYFADANGVVR